MNVESLRLQLLDWIDLWYAEADFWLDQSIDVWYPYFGERIPDFIRPAVWLSREQSAQLLDVIVMPWINAYFGDADLFTESYLPDYPERLDQEWQGGDLVNAQFLAMRKILGSARGTRHFS